jgi:transcriptional regulator with XRE-family HTH domain
MAKFQEKKETLLLRKKGESIKSIAQRVGVSRSTVSLWCQNIVLTSKQKEVLRLRMIQGGNEGRMKGRNANILQRQNNIATEERRAQKMLGKLSQRDAMMIGIGLYWGEGSKKNERRFIFTNSDETIIRCMINWLSIIGIPPTEIVGQIYINAQHQDRINIVQKFWVKKLGIHDAQLRKTVLTKTPHKKYYANRDSYFGTFRLMVKKSTKLQYLTMGLLGVIGSQI